LEAELPPNVVKAVQMRVKEKNLEEIIQELTKVRAFSKEPDRVATGLR
jgi:hypothetical protein